VDKLTREVWLPNWLSFLSGVPTLQRKRMVLVAIQTYVDESEGKDTCPLFVFSALMSEAENWATFSDKWSACLKEPPSIQYFKMDEAAGRDNEFYGFSDDERNRKLTNLCHVINEFDLRELHCILDLTVFKQMVSPKPLSDPYFFPFQTIIAAVGYDLFERGRDEPFEIFFDENRIFGPRAKVWYPVIRHAIDEPIRSLLPVEPMFRSDRNVMPLQAADLTAWIRRMINSEGLGEFSWLQQELNISASPNSVNLNADLLKWMDNPTNSGELRDKMKSALEAYRKQFGHEWPPKNKAELKKHRGR
jgi:hypothetical protein